MTTQTSTTTPGTAPRLRTSPADRLARWLEPIWIESEDGFPHQSVRRDPAFDSAAVVATAAGLALTESQVLRSIAFAEFLAGHAFDPEERQRVYETSVADFRGEAAIPPAQALKDSLEISAAVEAIPGMSGIVRSKLRTTALTRIVLDQQRSGLPSSPSVALIEKYNPVIAIDPERGLVVTDDAVLAWRRLRQIIAETSGFPFDWHEAGFRAEVEENYEAWPIERARSLAEAHAGLVSVTTGLRRLDDDQLAELAETIAEQTETAGNLEVAAMALGQVGRVNDLISSIRRRLTTTDPETLARELAPELAEELD